MKSQLFLILCGLVFALPMRAGTMEKKPVKDKVQRRVSEVQAVEFDDTVTTLGKASPDVSVVFDLHAAIYNLHREHENFEQMYSVVTKALKNGTRVHVTVDPEEMDLLAIRMK